MSPLLGEFMGTAMLVLLGDGVVANVLLKDSKGEGAGWGVISAGWAFAVMVGVFVAIQFGSNDAHINPAVTLGFAILTGDYSKLVPYTLAQCGGAAVGALLLYVAYSAHWSRTEDPGLKLACFSTGPAVRSPLANVMTEAVGTLVLMLGVAAIFSHAVSATGPAAGLGPFLVGALVWAVGLSIGGPTGYAVNPARDLMPRLVYTVLPIKNKGSSDFAYSWVPVVGPLLGSAIAAVIMKTIA